MSVAGNPKGVTSVVRDAALGSGLGR